MQVLCSQARNPGLASGVRRPCPGISTKKP